MKARWGCLLLLVLALCGGEPVVAEEESLFTEKLPFANATISYTLSGMENGVETRYIADHGKRSAVYRETTSSMMGTSIEVKTVEILEGEWLYSYDLVEQTGSKSRNPMLYLEEEYASLSDTDKEIVKKNRSMLGMNMMSTMGGKVEQNVEEMFGYPCDRVSYNGIQVVSIHDTSLALRTETNMMGITTKSIATSLETGEVDGKWFAHPPDIEAVHDEESDAMSRDMARQTIDMLKNPEAGSGRTTMGQGRMQLIPQEDQAEIMKQMEEMMKNMPALQGN